MGYIMKSAAGKYGIRGNYKKETVFFVMDKDKVDNAFCFIDCICVGDDTCAVVM